MNNRLRGTGVALVTPFDENLNIDWNSLEKLLDHTASEGVNYYVVQGTTGESATTTREEKSAILKFVKEHNPYNLPIVYGLGGNNTASVMEEMKTIDLEGVDAVLSVCPYYNKPSQDGLIRHYSVLADRCPVPLLLYNVPARTACNITADTTLQLADHENIIGIKEASGDFAQCLKLAKNKPDDFLLISGDDLFTLPVLSIGGVGVISVMANAFSAIFRSMLQAALANDYEEARRSAFKLVDINPLMYAEGNPVGIKEVLSLQGICRNFTRLPLLSASEALRRDIKKAFDTM